jgi:hypothetical protein
MSKSGGYWPEALLHLHDPYDDGFSDHVVLAEIDDSPRRGMRGFRTLATALVPTELVEEVLSAEGGIGWQVDTWGPLPSVDRRRPFDATFWVDGRSGSGERFQTIINAWRMHDREVVLPDNVMLMTYGLVPRHLSEGSVAWDDPRSPVYAVVRVRPYVNYSNKTCRPLAQVTMRREYLEDYCSLKGCAAVAVYYEERWSHCDENIQDVLKGREGVELTNPGHRITVAVLKEAKYREAPQFNRAWGCRLILRPCGRPVTDAVDPVLVWPEDKEPMTLERASASWIYAWVRDDVLREYESRPEFQVAPESGGVSYGGWWATSHTKRVGRHHIRVELKKLYEGTPPHVIAHWHRFAVPQQVAQLDRERHGDRNVAVRAKDVVDAFLRLAKQLCVLSDRLRLSFSQEDIGSSSLEQVNYSGWWTLLVAAPLGHVVPICASGDDFVERAVRLFKLLECLKPAPLRNALKALGVPRETVAQPGALKLLASLAQLADVAVAEDLNLVDDAASIVERWNPETRLDVMKRVFSLNALRVAGAHAPGAGQQARIDGALEAFGIDPRSTAGGWGYAIDALYDGLASDLAALTELLAVASD